MPEAQQTSRRRSAKRFEVARLDDLEEGQIRIAQAGGREVGVIRWGERVFAVRNVCPHVAGPACGQVRRRLTAGADHAPVVGDADRPVVVCAWHKWEFELPSGKAVADPKLKVKTYDVEIDDDGGVWITI